jgi:hypothetical protein
MAVFTEKRTPYEFLVRWSNEGIIQGAHIGWLDTVLKDAEVISQTPTNVESIAIGITEGFPLADILNQFSIDCMLKSDTLKLEIEELKKQIEELKKQ